MYRTVFVIDDSPIDRALTSVIIQKKQLAENVMCFSSGQDALLYIAQNRDLPLNLPDIIFLDIHMPHMDGFGFLDNYMLQEAANTNKPIVFIVSSSTFETDHNKIKNYPIVRRFILKPLTFDSLDEVMATL
jgi:CheY-like chemotaxis protein